MKTLKFIGIITILFLFCLTGLAQKVNEKCAIRGWVQDKEPRKDIYLYSGPGQINPFKPYPIVGSLDNSTESGEEKPVEIIGFKLHPRAGKWIEIRKATDLTGRVLFAGDGWIPFERVIAQAWSPDKKVVPLYSQPKLSSKKVRTIPAQTSLTIIGFDCFGLKVRYKGQSGWLSADNIKN